eukprot:CAMPEP_0176245250 /NCGR_PEP_ID=MMETSP0121_2-20121125/31846_1 /TAXON_ID=160619 /ORGANISM="Kryptoperidinium foliaceum, Strain CCMP 1326" /LENGTH=152 /DNA_ID=CAMNT_0017584875 /DNA_START=182 /DNA_END=637 /DNA_ORIENTATION=+
MSAEWISHTASPLVNKVEKLTTSAACSPTSPGEVVTSSWAPPTASASASCRSRARAALCRWPALRVSCTSPPSSGRRLRGLAPRSSGPRAAAAARHRIPPAPVASLIALGIGGGRACGAARLVGGNGADGCTADGAARCEEAASDCHSSQLC